MNNNNDNSKKEKGTLLVFTCSLHHCTNKRKKGKKIPPQCGYILQR